MIEIGAGGTGGEGDAVAPQIFGKKEVKTFYYWMHPPHTPLFFRPSAGTRLIELLQQTLKLPFNSNVEVVKNIHNTVHCDICIVDTCKKLKF